MANKKEVYHSLVDIELIKGFNSEKLLLSDVLATEKTLYTKEYIETRLKQIDIELRFHHENIINDRNKAK